MARNTTREKRELEYGEMPSPKRRARSFANLPLEIFVNLAYEIGRGDPKDLITFCRLDKATYDICKNYRSNIPLTSFASIPMNLLQYARYWSGDFDPVRDWLSGWWNWTHDDLEVGGNSEEEYDSWLDETQGRGKPLEDFYGIDPRTIDRNDLLAYVMRPPTDDWESDSTLELLLSEKGYESPSRSFDAPRYLAEDLEDAKQNASMNQIEIIGAPLDDEEDRENYFLTMPLRLETIAYLFFPDDWKSIVYPRQLVERVNEADSETREVLAQKFRAYVLSEIENKLPPDTLSNPSFFDLFKVKLALGHYLLMSPALYLFTKFDFDQGAIHPNQPDYWQS